MKFHHPTIASMIAVALVLAGVTAQAADKEKTKQPEKITLEDVIFDVSYLKKLLGPKTLVTAVVESNRGRTKSNTAIEDTVKAIKEAHLDEKSQIFLLPDGATEPVLQSSVPHAYGPGIKISRQEKKADFLMLIGADGAVKCLYCFNQNDRLFALAAAMAVVKWHYEPAKVGGTAVPVLAGLPMSLLSEEVRLMNPNRRNFETGRQPMILLRSNQGAPPSALPSAPPK
ncbi:MAG TPA: hypothetical protein VG734_03810 [Lacunisphaera sp.]|nr:hypothetical protein [Lacunisphaera sp.]